MSLNYLVGSVVFIKYLSYTKILFSNYHRQQIFDLRVAYNSIDLKILWVMEFKPQTNNGGRETLKL